MPGEATANNTFKVYPAGIEAALQMGNTTEAPNKIFFDTFNNPHLEIPRLGQSLTVRFPREAVLMLDTGLPTA